MIIVFEIFGLGDFPERRMTSDHSKLRKILQLCEAFTTFISTEIHLGKV